MLDERGRSHLPPKQWGRNSPCLLNRSEDFQEDISTNYNSLRYEIYEVSGFLDVYEKVLADPLLPTVPQLSQRYKNSLLVFVCDLGLLRPGIP